MYANIEKVKSEDILWGILAWSGYCFIKISVSKIISLYSADEENWLQGKLRIFEECWNRVPVSDDLVSEFVMFTYDVPLSKNFVPDHLAVFNERYLLMMKMHSEFTNMNRFEQEELWKKNILYGSAMNLVKLECCKGGKEQWHFVYPTYLNETWKGKNILGQKNIKKIDMDIANSFSGKVFM